MTGHPHLVVDEVESWRLGRLLRGRLRILPDGRWQWSGPRPLDRHIGSCPRTEAGRIVREGRAHPPASVLDMRCGDPWDVALPERGWARVTIPPEVLPPAPAPGLVEYGGLLLRPYEVEALRNSVLLVDAIAGAVVRVPLDGGR